MRRTPPPPTALHGRWLVLARIVWLIVALVCIGLLVVGLPLLYRSIASFNHVEPPLPAAIRTGLAELGFPEWLYVLLRFTSMVAVVLGFMGMGALIFWRRPDDRGAVLVSLQLVVFGMIFLPSNEILTPSPWNQFVVNLAFLSFFFSGYWFPNGRFVPRWTRWLLLVWLWMSADVFFEGTFLDANTWPPLIGIPFAVLLLGGGIGAQVYRYRRVAGPVERQQIKWLVWGFTAAIACFILFQMPFGVVPALSAPGRIAALYDMIFSTIQLLSFLLVPLAIGYAMLRYRLYDVDIIINRTLVYGALTVLLALVYFGSVFGLQRVLAPFIGPDSDVATIVSTLAIAALFNPLRRRIQAFIDRRFYRRKYDAAQVLAAFATTARDEVDLDRLTNELLAVVEETLQPAHVSLWLREPERET